jgi:hypothetical protein
MKYIQVKLSGYEKKPLPQGTQILMRPKTITEYWSDVDYYEEKVAGVIPLSHDPGVWDGVDVRIPVEHMSDFDGKDFSCFTVSNKISKSIDYLTDFASSYPTQLGFDDYTTETFMDDMLYGLGVSLSDDYRFSIGFKQFKIDLINHLRK